MKRFAALFLILLLVFMLAACGNGEQQEADPPVQQETETTENQEDSGTDTAGDASQSIVVYFSGTGNTKQVAETMAAALGTKTLEIVPEEPYTEADLNYNDDDCRANREMQDDHARPGIDGDLSEVSEYETIYLGYPIWWGTAPRIIQTFMESYDLSGKTVYTFCTSGGSGIDQSVSDLKDAYQEVNIADGHRFSRNDTQETIQAWLESLK